MNRSMPSFRKTGRKWLSDVYDRLGLVIMSSLTWFGIILGLVWVIIRVAWPNMLLVFLALATAYVLLIAPITAGVFFLARRIVTRDDPSLSDVFHGTITFAMPAWTLGLAQVAVTTIILVNMWFYLTRHSLALNLIGVLCIYVMLLWSLASVYHYPILVEQRPGALKILKRGFLLTADNVTFTAKTFSVIILLTCLCIVIPFCLPLLFAGTASILQVRALRALFVKYGLLEPEREPEADEGLVLPPILCDNEETIESQSD